jgi:hypothetical protein
MATEKTLVNRIAQSGLITFKLENYVPQVSIAHFDIKAYLFKELILKEQDFRDALKAHDWTQYQDQVLLVYCSSDAIIPMWASMLIATHAQPYTQELYYGTESDYYGHVVLQAIEKLDLKPFVDGRVIVKGCADYPIPPVAYLKITEKLRPVAKSIMFGEPCSTVPLYKKPKQS